MGHAPGRDAAEARVPRADRLKSTLAVPRLRPGEGRECTLLACLSIASGTDYDTLMGASGAAFTTAIDADGWDPLAASPLDDATLDRAAAAAGVRPDRVDPPFDDDLRALVGERIAESLAAKIPPLVRGIVGPPEYGLVVGYDGAARIHVRTYFDPTEQAPVVGWDAFSDATHGGLVFLDAGRAPERAAVARAALRLAAGSADAGDDAMRAWLAGLRDEERWRDRQHGGTFAFADHAMRTILADKRRAAARFLRAMRDALPARAGGDMLRAAEAYGHVAAAAEKVGTGAFDPGVAVRFVEGGQRRAWANALEGILGHEAAAHEALRSASMMA